MGKVKIYTDGSANNNTKCAGGYGVYIENGSIKLFSGGQYVNTSSARMEIMGCIAGLKKCEPGDIVDIYCDNQYVINSFAKGWVFKWENSNWRDAGKPGGKRINYDLFKQLLIQYRRLNNKVTFHWVKGHRGNYENECCDQLAAIGGMSKNLIVDKQ